MAEFKAGAELDISIPDDQLRSARDQIERDLGDVSVSVDPMVPDGGQVMASGGAPDPSPQPRDPATGQFASPMGPEEFERTSMSLAEERNEILLDIYDEVQEGSIVGGAGRGGGGGDTTIIPTGVPRGLSSVGRILGPVAAATAGFGIFQGINRLGQQGTRELGERFPDMTSRLMESNEFQRMAADPASFLLQGPQGMIPDIGTMVGEQIAVEMQNSELPEPGWMPDLLNWDPSPPEIGRDELSDRIRETGAAGSERAGDVDTQAIIDRARTTERLRETGTAGSERAGDVNTQEVKMNASIAVNNDVLLKDDRNLDREMERVKRELEDRIRREISTGAGGRI